MKLENCFKIEKLRFIIGIFGLQKALSENNLSVPI